MKIEENLASILKDIPSGVKLVAVSKTIPSSRMQEAYEAGQRVFGENKVQEMREKQPLMPNDVEWHLIGHLQTNKIKYIAPYVHLIHSVDSLNLLQKINEEAEKNQRIINCLLQIRIAQEETKFGISEQDAEILLKSDAFHQMKYVQIVGVMGIGTFTSDKTLIRSEYRMLKQIFDRFRVTYFADQPSFKEISMGMSEDFKFAIEEGSTIVRVGSAIFGSRNYGEH